MLLFSIISAALCLAFASDIPYENHLLQAKLENTNISDESILEYIDGCTFVPYNVFFKNAVFDSIERSRLGVLDALSNKNQFDINMINTRDYNKRYTLLGWAAKCNQENAVRELVHLGVDVNASAEDGRTALHLSAENGNFDIARFLLEHGAVIDVRCLRGKYVLYYAVSSRNEKLIYFLLDEYSALVNHHKDDILVLDNAMITNNIKPLKRMVETGLFNMNLNYNHDEPNLLEMAIARGNTEAVQYLMSKGAVLHSKESGKTLLMYASESFYLGMVRFLVEQMGEDINARDGKGRTALMYVSDTDILKYLISKGASINDADNDGNTALILAARIGKSRLRLVNLLILYGADLEHRNFLGQTALFSAVEHNQDEMVDLLLMHKNVNPNIVTNTGDTPLTYAARQSYYNTVKSLLKYADPNYPDSNGHTALHYATMGNKTFIVNLLIRNGADPNLNK